MQNHQRFRVSVFAIAIHYFLAAGFIALCSQLNPSGVQAQTTQLMIAAEDDAAPWSRADGTGFANDVVTAAFKAVRIHVNFRVMPYARCKRMAVNGDIAACLNMSPAPEFSGLVELSAKPLFTCYAGYFYNLGKPPHVSRQEDLPPKTVVGTVIGYEYPAQFEALRKTGVIVLEESPSEVINLRKLALGRVDLALLNYNEMKSPQWLIMRAGVAGKVKTSFRAGVLDSYIGFSKKHSQGSWARQQFNKGYGIIVANGTLRNLRKAWLQKLAGERTPSRR